MTAQNIAPGSSTAPVLRRNELALRLVTAAFGIPAVLAVIWLGGPLYTAVVAVLLGVGAAEIYRAAGWRLTAPESLAGVAAAAGLAGAAHLGDEALAAVLTALVTLSLVSLVLQGMVETGLRGWTLVLGGAIYPGLLGSHLVSLRLAEEGRAWVLLAIFTTFATDTGAYAVGRLLGRHKLAPKVSPGKTIEGGIGGLVLAGLACVGLNAGLDLDEPMLLMLTLGLGIGVAGQLGDLAESLLKRSLGVKDMGRIFPGHGGVLDRLDSVLFVTPLVYYVVRWGIM